MFGHDYLRIGSIISLRLTEMVAIEGSECAVYGFMPDSWVVNA